MLSCTRPSGLEVSAHFRHSHNALIQSNLQKASSYKSQSETNYLVNSSSKSFTHQLSTKQCLHILATQKASVCSGSIFLHIGKKSPALNIRFQLARLEVNCLVSCSRTSMYGHVCSDHPCKRSAKAQHLSCWPFRPITVLHFCHRPLGAFLLTSARLCASFLVKSG